ncbi:MAG: hypothetical protein ACP5UQ_17445, partial [Anaerolineae bacterium]
EPPSCEVEIVPAAGDLRRKLTSQPGGAAFWWKEAPAGLVIGGRGEAAAAAADRLRPFVEQYGPRIRRLSLRPRRPHLMLFLNLNDVNGSAAGLIHALRKALD